MNISWTLQLEIFLREGKYYTRNKLATAAHVAREDTALVAAKVLANDTFENHIINVTGPQSLNRETVSEIIREILGVNMTTEEVTEEIFIHKYIANGHSNISAKDENALDSLYASGKWSHVSNAVQNLKLQEPESFKSWLLRHKMQYSISESVSNKSFSSLN